MLTPSVQAAPSDVHYRTVTADGLEIFYREAGDPKAPTILLLHGFPTSSHMFRDLIPLLADRFHLIAPDYPGFGYSARKNLKQVELHMLDAGHFALETNAAQIAGFIRAFRPLQP